MSDALLTIQDRQEALSRVYTRAIAASAGYTTQEPDFDRDSIDVILSAGGEMRPSIHIQLKATTKLRVTGSHAKFVLSRKNYDDLRIATQAPRILVVLSMPRNENRWVGVTIAQLVLRKSAYWMSLKGSPDLPPGQKTTTVLLPAQNRFDVGALTELMERARKGDIS